ncbi:hypothetical protein AVEN_221165-1, partial [Araneus ventricosus]
RKREDVSEFLTHVHPSVGKAGPQWSLDRTLASGPEDRELEAQFHGRSVGYVRLVSVKSDVSQTPSRWCRA